MPNQRIGECSICGGDVIGWVGAYWSTVPPPPPRCVNCGAVSAAHDSVIPMRAKHGIRVGWDNLKSAVKTRLR